MDEPEFWARLEYRICDEFRGLDDDHLRFYWCDSLVPERHDTHGEECHISGLAWIGQHKQTSQQRWEFTLVVRHARDRDEIDWHGLLPGDRLTGWLTPDPSSKTLKIDPAAGRND